MQRRNEKVFSTAGKAWAILRGNGETVRQACR